MMSNRFNAEYKAKLITPDEAVKVVKSGDWCLSYNRTKLDETQ